MTDQQQETTIDIDNFNSDDFGDATSGSSASTNNSASSSGSSSGSASASNRASASTSASIISASGSGSGSASGSGSGSASGDNPMILGLPLAQVEQQIIAMIAANCNHAPGKIVNRSPPNRAPPHEWRFHRTPRDADAQQQVCAACKQPHDGRVSSYVIKLHTRSAEVHYVCEKTKCSVVIGKIAGASNSHIACGNKRKRGNASEWSYDGNYDRIGQPLAPKALWVEQLAQWRQRAYHDERDEILEAIRSIISPGAILVDTLKEQQQPQTEEEQRRVQCEQRDLLQFRIAADIEIVHTVHIDRGTGLVSMSNDSGDRVIIHRLYDEYFQLSNASAVNRIVTESGERFSVDECRKAFHYERFTVNSLLRALRRGVEYMNRFYAAVRDEASGVISFVAKDFVATGTSSGVAHRKTTCILRTVETSAAMHGEQSEVIVNALDLRCLASLVTRDGAVSAAPLVDFAAHMKARSVMAIWLESGALRRCYARRRFQPLPPRGIGRLHPYIDDRFRDATSNADNDDELPTYRFNQRDYEDIACLGGYRLVALAHLYHCYNVFVSRDDTIWREWLGFYAHFAQMPFENCAQILAVLCARGSGKSVSVEWIAACMADEHVQTSATAHQCLGQFNAPLQHKTFVFLDEYHGPSLSTECSRSLNLLATADRISIQAKHRNPVECRNFSHVVVASDQADALGGGGGGGSGGGSSRRGEVANTNGAGQRQRRPLICCTDASLLDFDTRAREAAYFGLLMERLGRSADKFGHCTIANLYYSIDLTQLPFNASANAKDTKAREEQAVKAMSTVQLFVKRILDGSIVAPRQQQDASCTVQAPAPFWTDIAGSDDKTFTRAVSVDDFFATYRAEMLSEGKMTDLTRDDFCKEMAKYLPERIDTTHKKAAKADLAQRDDVVVISRATTEVVRGGQSERPRMHRWPKWSVCCKAFKMATGVGFEPWRAADDNDEDADIVQSTSSVGTISASASTTIASASSASASTSTSLGGSAADSKEGADNVKDAATAYGCFCDDVLLLAKPMRADPVLFKPNTQCRQLCCYFNVRVIESDGWVQDQYLGRALDTGLAMARSNVAAFEAACASARCSDDNDDSILPRLDDYVPEQSYELCSVPPLERVPPAIRHCAQDFANRHGVDVALLLLPDGVWATVQTETAQTATAQHHQRNGGLCAALTQATCNRRLSRLSIARDASCAPLARAGVARGDSIAATSSCSAAREQMARIEVRMEPALRIGEEYMRPLDIVLRRRTRASGDKGPVVCVALWGRLGRDCNGSGCFVKPLVRYKDLVFNHY